MCGLQIHLEEFLLPRVAVFHCVNYLNVSQMFIAEFSVNVFELMNGAAVDGSKNTQLKVSLLTYKLHLNNIWLIICRCSVSQMDRNVERMLQYVAFSTEDSVDVTPFLFFLFFFCTLVTLIDYIRCQPHPKRKPIVHAAA